MRVYLAGVVFVEGGNVLVEPEQWLQRHPEAGSSWPIWPKASQYLTGVVVVEGGNVQV